MPIRVDVLGSDPARLAALRGRVLSPDLDDELQEYVHRAAALTGAPISLVTIMLPRTQRFRAQHQLPEELATAKETDRDLSICQFVVRDEMPFEVCNAQDDDRIPQLLVKQYNIGAYFGVPVRTNGVVVGALCVIDTVTRIFSESEKDSMIRLAVLVSERLQRLAQETDPKLERLFKAGTEPAFDELRDLLTSLTFGVQHSQSLSDELEPLRTSKLRHKIFNENLEQLRTACDSLEELTYVQEDISEAANRVLDVVGAVDAPKYDETSQVSAIVTAGLLLARNATKLVGGVQTEDGFGFDSVLCPAPVGACLLSAVVAALAEMSSKDTRLSVDLETTTLEVLVNIKATPPPASGVLSPRLQELAEFAESICTVSVDEASGGARLTFVRAHPVSVN